MSVWNIGTSIWGRMSNNKNGKETKPYVRLYRLRFNSSIISWNNEYWPGVSESMSWATSLAEKKRSVHVLNISYLCKKKQSAERKCSHLSRFLIYFICFTFVCRHTIWWLEIVWQQQNAIFASHRITKFIEIIWLCSGCFYRITSIDIDVLSIIFIYHHQFHVTQWCSYGSNWQYVKIHQNIVSCFTFVFD